METKKAEIIKLELDGPFNQNIDDWCLYVEIKDIESRLVKKINMDGSIFDIYPLMEKLGKRKKIFYKKCCFASFYLTDVDFCIQLKRGLLHYKFAKQK